MEKKQQRVVIFAVAVCAIALLCGACSDSKTKKLTPDVQIGDEVFFGAFNDEPIPWIVLALENNKAFVISNDAENKTVHQYSDMPPNISADGQVTLPLVSWADCSLREWLNSKFLDSFSGDELARIQYTELDGEGGVKDRVFILSVEEAEKYFLDDEARCLWRKKNGKGDKILLSVAWWLRSPEAVSRPPFVAGWGWICRNNNYEQAATYFVTSRLRVRPAMWVSLEGLE